MQEFDKALSQLNSDLVTQGGRVQEQFLKAVECFFDLDLETAKRVINGDIVIDRVDVEIERASIPLLCMGETDQHKIRSVLTIVKVNNELERIADCAVNVAEVVTKSANIEMPIPQTFRVMANSVAGMLRDTNKALAQTDMEKAQSVLAFDDTVDRFKTEILLDAQKKVASGAFSFEFGFKLYSVVKSIERVADHCTNICEQVIYLDTGRIVRHLPEGWTQPATPEDI